MLALIAALALLAPVIAGATYPAKVARTGQTTCYDASGNVIDCSGTGQDGDWLAGVPWPNPRFTVNGDDVTDGLTGLIWAKNANLIPSRDPAFDTDYDISSTWQLPNDGFVTWQHALDYVAKLNNENYLNHNDWRLPNVNELESLANAQLFNPALPQGHPFTNVWSEGHWSSTSRADGTVDAWIIRMGEGAVISGSKSSSYCSVWPVRSGQCGALGNSVICLPKTGQTLCYKDNGTEFNRNLLWDGQNIN